MCQFDSPVSNADMGYLTPILACAVLLGITVLFVSHSVEQVLNICNKAIILDHGRLIASGSAEEICAQYNEMVKKK